MGCCDATLSRYTPPYAFMVPTPSAALICAALALMSAFSGCLMLASISTHGFGSTQESGLRNAHFGATQSRRLDLVGSDMFVYYLKD